MLNRLYDGMLLCMFEDDVSEMLVFEAAHDVGDVHIHAVPEVLDDGFRNEGFKDEVVGECRFNIRVHAGVYAVDGMAVDDVVRSQKLACLFQAVDALHHVGNLDLSLEQEFGFAAPEDIIDAGFQNVRKVRKHGYVRQGLAPFPFADSLKGYADAFAEFGLSDVFIAAQFSDDSADFFVVLSDAHLLLNIISRLLIAL